MSDIDNVVQPLVEEPIPSNVQTPENPVASIPTASSEQIPVVQQPSQDDNQQDVVTSTPQATIPATQVSNVVDMRADDTDDDVQVKTDHKVTEEADKEEEEFIDHVEEVHSIAS